MNDVCFSHCVCVCVFVIFGARPSVVVVVVVVVFFLVCFLLEQHLFTVGTIHGKPANERTGEASNVQCLGPDIDWKTIPSWLEVHVNHCPTAMFNQGSMR